jgi:hypothetical protein
VEVTTTKRLTMAGDAGGAYNAEHFNVTFPREYVVHVEINRAEKMNAFHEAYVGPTLDTLLL